MPEALLRIEAAAVAPVAWRNGGGLTRELLRVPAGDGDDWQLRISLADITADGPFSAFEGITRWFAVVAGAGVRLAWPDEERTLRAGDAPIRFDGAHAPLCRLVDGATRDLNVMARDARTAAAMERAEPGTAWRSTAPARGAFTLRAAVLARGGIQVELPARTLAWAATGDTSAWTLLPTATDDAQAGAPAGFWISAHPAPATP